MKASTPAPAPALDLRYDFEAITRLAEVPSGINLLDGLNAEVMKDPKVYILLVWAGLLHTSDALTVTDARAKIRGMAPRAVISLVTKALARDIAAEESEQPAADDGAPV